MVAMTPTKTMTIMMIMAAPSPKKMTTVTKISTLLHRDDNDDINDFFSTLFSLCDTGMVIVIVVGIIAV